MCQNLTFIGKQLCKRYNTGQLCVNSALKQNLIWPIVAASQIRWDILQKKSKAKNEVCQKITEHKLFKDSTFNMFRAIVTAEAKK